MSEAEAVRVFVYGTLKPGGLYWYRFCEGKVSSVQPACIPGRLYELGAGYPALLPGWGSDIVEDIRQIRAHGFVLTLAHAEVLAGLDQLEGYEEGRDASMNEYQRVRAEAFLMPDEAPCEVWVYVMNSESITRDGGVLIENGNWQGT